MLESGESARFIARRLVILASEDVGLADPLGLLVAEAAARAVEFVGLPEARLTLAHATLTLSLMPKSNSVTRALGAATAAVRAGGLVEVPAHLRDAHYASAASLGHGEEYRYAHDYPERLGRPAVPAGRVGATRRSTTRRPTGARPHWSTRGARAPRAPTRTKPRRQ